MREKIIQITFHNLKLFKFFSKSSDHRVAKLGDFEKLLDEIFLINDLYIGNIDTKIDYFGEF